MTIVKLMSPLRRRSVKLMSPLRNMSPKRGKKSPKRGKKSPKKEAKEKDIEDKKTPVGYKISELMSEGYPQKQAVAIALTMQNNGSLGPKGEYKRKKKKKKKN